VISDDVMMMMMMMMMQTVKQSRCCKQMLDSATSCVHGKSKMVDELLSWISETLSVMTTNFNATPTEDIKLAETQIRQHAVSLISYIQLALTRPPTSTQPCIPQRSLNYSWKVTAAG